MRKLLRSIARANMEALGVTTQNKKRAYQTKDKKWVSSYFAENWRKFATPQACRKAQKARIMRRAAQ
ncbi:MAG: hypothetical protein GX418_12060 [Clostridiales bacterium]|nr:hypothetical protein [Clostridiales bacterium]